MKVPKISMIPLCLPTNHFSPNPLIVFTWIPKGHGQFGTFLWLNLPWLINAKTQKKLLTWITNSQTPWIVQGQTERFFFSLKLRTEDAAAACTEAMPVTYTVVQCLDSQQLFHCWCFIVSFMLVANVMVILFWLFIVQETDGYIECRIISMIYDGYRLLFETVTVALFIGRAWKRLAGNHHSIPTTKKQNCTTADICRPMWLVWLTAFISTTRCAE